jgi:hypothetical protein
MRATPPIAIPTMVPGDSGLVLEFSEEFVALLTSVDEGIGASSNVNDIDSVIGEPLVVDTGSTLAEVIVDDLPVIIVVCLVIVTIELFGIV